MNTGLVLWVLLLGGMTAFIVYLGVIIWQGDRRNTRPQEQDEQGEQERNDRTDG